MSTEHDHEQDEHGHAHDSDSDHDSDHGHDDHGYDHGMGRITTRLRSTMKLCHGRGQKNETGGMSD